MNGAFGPVHIPDAAWRSGPARTVLQQRDAAGILRLAQQHAGVSQHRLANAVGILQGRVSEILKGTRTVTTFEVYERIAEGLNMPDHARLTLGLAPRRTNPADPGLDLGEVLDVFPNQAQASSDIRATARDAADIRILAVRALGLVGLKDSLLRDAVTRQDQPPNVTILLSDPDAASTATRAAEIGESADSFTGGIKLSLTRLAELRRDGLAVYLYDALPVWRLIALDETLYVSAFATIWEGHESPTYKIVTTSGGALHGGFTRTFRDLQDHATRVI
jgi:transcriptional regulator with XRE-family HTH domain